MLLEGNVAPHIRRLSLPLAWGLLAMTLYNVLDAWFISKLGTDPLAAFGFTLPVVMLFMSVIFGLSIGTTSVISRVFGEAGIEQVRQIATDALTLTAALTVSASLLGFIVIDPLFRLMGAKADLMPMIHRYMTIWYCGMPFLGVMMVGNSCVRATGDTYFPSKMTTLQAILSAIFAPLFIFGPGFFPRLELAGSATGCVAAYYTTCMLSLYILIFRYKILGPLLAHPDMLKSWRRILHVAVPSVVSNLIGPVSMGVITWMASSFGREAVAALGIANRVEGFVTIVSYAMGAGISIFSGQNFGAGNFGRVREAALIGTRWSIVWGLLCAAFLFVFAHDIPRFFGDSGLVAEHATRYFHWVPVSYAGLGTLIVCNAVFNSTGKPLPATMLIFFKAALLYIPLAWLLKGHFGFQGIVMALTVTNMTIGIMAFVWHRKATS